MTVKPMPEPLSKALAMLVVGHTLSAVADHLRWPVGAVRKLALAQRGWLIGEDNRVSSPGRVRITTVPDGVHREHLEWAQQLLQGAPAPRPPAREVPPPTRRPGVAATQPAPEPVTPAPRRVAELVDVHPELPPVDEPAVPAVLAGLIGPAPVAAPPPVEEAAPAAKPARRTRPAPQEDVRPDPEPVTVPAPPKPSAAAEPAEEAPAEPEVPTKDCGRCGDPKPHAEFYRSTQTADGLSPWCKACFRAVR
ncbi:hypothetical protein JOL79_11600 [Microbispora sp. RL4-1S]|uniref:Uncharacterized protein n=1 Tax=Microbispora oryzae TaxID=2806554 RepID=A0A941AQ88_9ACTN|nr:hypothetical protein [Microbispora oryzae]MBP2704459.1 hypothetical protein [Microbispora oryzae]